MRLTRYVTGVLLICATAATGVCALVLNAPTPVMLAWLLVFGLATMLLRCPACGLPLFRRGPLWTPWPSRVCRCGHRLDE